MKQVKKSKSYLVAGGAGFIGSHLTERLLKEGNKVTVVDDLSTGSESNIKPLENENGFDFVKADICSYNDKNKYDYIYKLYIFYILLVLCLMVSYISIFRKTPLVIS